jgi:DHA2 family multidrug resistance protein
MTPGQSLAQLDSLTQGQAVMAGTDQMFMYTTLAFVVAAVVVWLAPKPKLLSGPAAPAH